MKPEGMWTAISRKKGVRYIAVNDGVDTGREESAGNDKERLLKRCSTILRQGRVQKGPLRPDGQTAGRRIYRRVGPLWLSKDPARPGRLVPDPDGALIVRRIYRDFLKEKASGGIARSLTREGVPTPLEKRGETRSGKGAWNESTIRRILTCETYAGNLTQNQSKTVSYKVKKRVPIPKRNGSWSRTLMSR